MRKRAATIIMMAGIALALVAGLSVFAMARQAKADRTAQVPQVLVVMAARDISDRSPVTADSLTMQAFPSDFVPNGAIASPDDAIGKFTTTQITKGQIVLSNQLSDTLRAGTLSLSVPEGMEAVALPMTDLMSSNGAIKAGDHVDILLTIDLFEIKLETAKGTPADAAGNANVKNPVTQTTLQNVEVLAVGEAAGESDDSGTSATTAGDTNRSAKGAVVVAVNPQDALVLKYAKDSGGVVDLALRAPGDTEQVTTDPVTIDRLFSRFNFQRPGPLP